MAMKGDARKTSFPDKSFDLLFANSTIEHVAHGKISRHSLENYAASASGYIVRLRPAASSSSRITLRPLLLGPVSCSCVIGLCAIVPTMA